MVKSLLFKVVLFPEKKVDVVVLSLHVVEDLDGQYVDLGAIPVNTR